MSTWIRRSVWTGLLAGAFMITGVGFGGAQESPDAGLLDPVTSLVSGSDAGSVPAESAGIDAAQGSVTISSEGTGEPVRSEDCPCDPPPAEPEPDPAPAPGAGEGCDCDLTLGTPTVNGQSAGSPAGVEVPADRQATVAVPVTNTGTDRLSSLSVSGPGGPMTCSADSLGAGRTTTCRGSFTPATGASSAPITAGATTAAGDRAEAVGTAFVTGTTGSSTGSGAGSDTDVAAGDAGTGSSSAGSVTVGSEGGYPIPEGAIEAGLDGPSAGSSGLIVWGFGALLVVAVFVTVAVRGLAPRRRR